LSKLIKKIYLKLAWIIVIHVIQPIAQVVRMEIFGMVQSVQFKVKS